ncbi:hypothetical protein HJC23_007004 [Cyclotella cryptica]|uniref:Uncharacterized protein n=1 Tax=Cyclotella cryptica TaxID=29204 RepID=A0ABD3QMG5_9STRA
MVLSSGLLYGTIAKGTRASLDFSGTLWKGCVAHVDTVGALSFESVTSQEKVCVSSHSMRTRWKVKGASGRRRLSLEPVCFPRVAK